LGNPSKTWHFPDTIGKHAQGIDWSPLPDDWWTRGNEWMDGTGCDYWKNVRVWKYGAWVMDVVIVGSKSDRQTNSSLSILLFLI
jgi:hypothetical protein